MYSVYVQYVQEEREQVGETRGGRELAELVWETIPKTQTVRGNVKYAKQQTHTQ